MTVQESAPAERPDGRAAAAGRPAEQPEPGRLEVSLVAGDAYAIRVRGHEVLTDQPHAGGGEDLAPTPVELFVASLASCVAFYAGRFLARHDLPREGLAVAAEYDMAGDRPARVAGVRLRVTAPAGMAPSQRKAFAAVVDHCTVHNSLRQPPEVTIEIPDPGEWGH